MIQKRPEKAARSPKGRKKGAKAAKAAKAAEAPGPEEAGPEEAGPEAAGPEAPDHEGSDTAVETEAAADGDDDSQSKQKSKQKEAAAKAAPKEPVDLDALALRIEALLFASGQVLGVRRLAKALKVTGDDIRGGIQKLATLWEERSSAIQLVEVSGGWRLMTGGDFHEDVSRLAAKTRVEKLSPAALETLAVVAYRQSIGRADIEAIRGVQCGPLLRVLLDRDLIRISGRSSEPGHPLLYGTTKRFLDHFGLASLKNLPDVKDLLNAS